MIIVKPLGGLCNRLRVLNSAFHLAIINNENVFVVWEKNAALNADFHQLFLPEKKFQFLDKSYRLNYFLIYRYKHIILSFDYLKKIILTFVTFNFIYIDDNKIKDKARFSLLHLTKKNIILNTCYPLFEHNAETNHYIIFKPVLHIQYRIDAIISKFNLSLLNGIHIRRTDNIKSIEGSNIDSFKELIFHSIELNKNVFFYLSTDDSKVDEDFLSHFKGHIKHLENKDFQRDTLKGIEDAVVDLFILSKTSKIYGSFWSSFTDVSSYINNVPLIIVR